MRTDTCRWGKKRQRDGDVKIERGPESGEVLWGQRCGDNSATNVQSVKERGFSAEFREAVNPKETAIQQNIYSANRVKREKTGGMEEGLYIYICICTRPAQYKATASVQMITILCILCDKSNYFYTTEVSKTRF